MKSESTLPAALRGLGALVASAPDYHSGRPFHDLTVANDSWSREVAIPLLNLTARTDTPRLHERGKVLMETMRRDIAIMLLKIDDETVADIQEVRATVLTSTIFASAVVAILPVLSLWLERRRRIIESEAKRFFETATDMLCVASLDGTFLRVNPSWSHTLGYPAEALTGRPFLEFVHPEDVRKTIDAMASLSGNQAVVGFHNRYRSKDGTYRSLVWNATPDVFQGLIYASARDETHRIQLEIELAAHSITDVLTGLPYRRWFLQQLDEAVAVASRYKMHCSVLFIDLDGFKTINDTLGHATGDVTLNQMASAMRASLRESDLMARLGGDEFAVLLPPIPTPHDSENVASKIVESISIFASTTAQLASISVSVGIAEFPRDCDNGKDLLARADAAMYATKRQGGGSFARYPAV